MKVKDFLKRNNSVSLDDLLNYIEGFDGWESVQYQLNKTTGFEKAVIDLDTSGKYSKNSVINSEIIESADVENSEMLNSDEHIDRDFKTDRLKIKDVVSENGESVTLWVMKKPEPFVYVPEKVIVPKNKISDGRLLFSYADSLNIVEVISKPNN